MHTDPNDPDGQDLVDIIKDFGLNKDQVMLSTSKLPAENLAAIYNVVDVTINISDAEGFGLSTLESLSCGTPIIATMTGGLQEQVTNGVDMFGIPLYPSSKALIGSQQVPYIYEDRLDKNQVVSALNKMYALGNEGRRQMGLAGLKHVHTNYNFNTYRSKWAEIMEKIYNSRGNYTSVVFKEVA